MDLFHKIQILPASIKNPISWNFSFTGVGQHIPAGLPYPPPPSLPHHHPGHCSSKFLEIMEWVFSASWVKLMKISCYRNIFCLFTTTSHYQCLGWRVGGQPIPAGLSYPPPKTLEQWLFTENEHDFKCYISENYENTLKFGHFLHVYNNQSLEMPWMTGGGQPIPAGLSYPPPMIFEHWQAMILLLLLIALTTINGFVSQNTDTAC